MIIECPACSKKFNIDEKLIPDEGRLLKCGNCEHAWFYKKEKKIKLEAEAAKITQIEEIKSEINTELPVKASKQTKKIRKKILKKDNAKLKKKNINKVKYDVVDVCTILEKCSIDEISKYLLDQGRKKDYPDITIRE